MKIKHFLLGCAALSLAFSCTVSSIQNLQPQQSRLNIASRSAQKVETLIERERMAAYLSALTGERAIAANTLIPERGTVRGRELTRQYLTETLTQLGYKVERHEYRRNGANIMTRLMAETPTDEYILVGAHMDSVRNAGADDNASGSTAVLEAATVLRELKNRQVNIIFAWFDEEELGLIGSRYLARDFRKQGLKLTSAHTIDMLGFDGDGDGAVELARPEGMLWDYYKMVNKTHDLNLPLDRTSTGQSDHVSFSREGFDSLCVSEEWTSRDSTPHYHRRSDTFSTINLDYLASSTRLVVAAVSDLARKVPPPSSIQILPHENFPNREREFHASYDEAASHL